MFKGKVKDRTVAIFLLLIVVFSSYVEPLIVQAHDAYSIQVLVNDSQLRYDTQVVYEVDGFWNVTEKSHHQELKIGIFAERFSTASGGKVELPEKPYDLEEWAEDKTGWFDTDLLVMSFQPVEFFSNNARGVDADRAYYVAETLGHSLNDVLYLLEGGKLDSAMDLYDSTKKLLDGGTQTFENGTFEITYGKRASYAPVVVEADLRKEGIRRSDFVKIEKLDADGNGTGEEYEFIWRVRKGYSAQGWSQNPVYYDFCKTLEDAGAPYPCTGSIVESDVTALTWHMFAGYANMAYYVRGISSSNASELQKVGRLEQEIVSIFENLSNGLRSMLGLYDLNELVFNEGVRGSAGWVHGIFPQQWENNMIGFHWIFQGVAWSLIALAILKMLIQKNLSTVNPALRLSLFEGVQNLLITGFILASIFPLMNMFMYLNSSLVDVFAALKPDMATLSDVGNYSGVLAGVLLQFFYFFVMIYFNFVYIMRSITVAILVSMGPLFVVTIAFGEKWRQLFSMWSRELISNIFIQSFHAFILSFFLTTTFSTRTIETLVIAFAMIPLSEFFRSMIMGQGGGMLGQMGMSSIAAGGAMVGATMKGASGLLGGGKEKSVSGGGSQSDSQISKNSDKMSGKQTSSGGSIQQQQKGTAMVGGALEKTQAETGKHMELDAFSKHENSNASKGAVSGGQQAGKSDASKLRAAGRKDARSQFSPTNVGKVLTKGALGAAQIGAGVGVALALGGVSGEALDMGRRNIVGGTSKMGSGAKDAYTMGSNAVNSVKAGNQAAKDATDASEPNQTPGEGFMDENLHVRELPNGDNEVQRDFEVLSEQGIMGAHTESDNSVVYSYDLSRMQEGDRANIESQAEIFRSGTDEQKEHLRKQGIEAVYQKGENRYAVKYNDVGREALGIKSVQKIGQNRIVETKAFHQPLETKMTIQTNNLPNRSTSKTSNAQTSGSGRDHSTNQTGSQTQSEQQKAGRAENTHYKHDFHD